MSSAKNNKSHCEACETTSVIDFLVGLGRHATPCAKLLESRASADCDYHFLLKFLHEVDRITFNLI